jgi:hypothetical protein
MIGLDDLDDPRTPEIPDEENWSTDHSDEPLSSDDVHDPTTENPFDALPPAPESDEEEKPKKKVGPTTATFIDWSKATPRKEDDFAPSHTAVGRPVTSDKVRDFLNHARQNQWYGLYYPVMEYPKRNSAQATVTKINGWRKGKTNIFGVRDGENIAAKCEAQGKDKFVVWVGLLLAEGQTLPEGMPAADE